MHIKASCELTGNTGGIFEGIEMGSVALVRKINLVMTCIQPGYIHKGR